MVVRRSGAQDLTLQVGETQHSRLGCLSRDSANAELNRSFSVAVSRQATGPRPDLGSKAGGPGLDSAATST